MNKSKLPVRVNVIWDATPEIRLFELLSADGTPLPAFTSGAHIDVYLSEHLVRQYSLCNAPGEGDRYLIAVKREANSRGGSAAMHDRIRKGDLIEIGAPRNNFSLHESARQHLLLAGGIGITPLLSMSLRLLSLGASFQLHYFTRSEGHTAFHDVLSGPEFRGKVSLHYGLQFDGLSTCLDELLRRRPEGGHLYLCGPRPFMDLVEGIATPRWSPESVHREYFTPDPISLDGPRRAFEVKLARSGSAFLVPEGKTIVQTLAEHGILVDTLCEEGVCGTCLTRVLGGIPDHRDACLTDEEKCAGNRMALCVSRAKSPMLVLDL